MVDKVDAADQMVLPAEAVVADHPADAEVHRVVAAEAPVAVHAADSHLCRNVKEAKFHPWADVHHTAAEEILLTVQAAEAVADHPGAEAVQAVVDHQAADVADHQTAAANLLTVHVPHKAVEAAPVALPAAEADVLEAAPAEADHPAAAVELHQGMEAHRAAAAAHHAAAAAHHVVEVPAADAAVRAHVLPPTDPHQKADLHQAVQAEEEDLQECLQANAVKYQPWADEHHMAEDANLPKALQAVRADLQAVLVAPAVPEVPPADPDQEAEAVPADNIEAYIDRQV
jgi:hypothetical protein